MAHYIVKDSTGVDRVIWSQEMNSSCGPACCYMVVCMIKKISMAGGEAFMRNLAIKYGATIFDLLVGSGTYGTQLRQILIDNGLRVDSRFRAENEYWSMALAASEERPMILNVAWENGGGHWVVCVGANRNGAIILDPWYGLSEIPLAALPAYNPDKKGQSVNSTNGFSGWFVRAI